MNMGSDVRRDRAGKSIVGSPQKRAGDGGDVERYEPAMRHLKRCCIVQGAVDKVLGLDNRGLVLLDRRGRWARTSTIGKETRAQWREKEDKLDLPFLSA